MSYYLSQRKPRHQLFSFVSSALEAFYYNFQIHWLHCPPPPYWSIYWWQTINVLFQANQIREIHGTKPTSGAKHLHRTRVLFLCVFNQSINLRACVCMFFFCFCFIYSLLSNACLLARSLAFFSTAQKLVFGGKKSSLSLSLSVWRQHANSIWVPDAHTYNRTRTHTHIIVLTDAHTQARTYTQP